MESQYDINEILSYLDPSLLNYQEWLSVGMILKDEGYDVSVWERWSSMDTPRYHTGECEKKWKSFTGSATPVTMGTLVQIAKDHGWQPLKPGTELSWDDFIGTKDDKVVIEKGWIEGKELQEPKQWSPAKELVTYLETLFDSTENVGYVTDTYEKEGKYMPTKGCWDRTAGELIEQLNKCDDDIGRVLGDYKEEAGAWIRFNPLDGNGCKNDNVTDYRYALVESDTVDIEIQNAIIRELELPVACLVYSGGKSIHAIVKIEAGNYEEYRKRVNYLYDVCNKNSLKIDAQNRNPSRLSRMPGVIRNGKKQYLIDTNIGKESWQEWQEWIEGVNDNLPDPEGLDTVWNHLPELSPPLIDGVLRQGHKMLLVGPSKAGKSYALIELCIAIAEGKKWLNWDCAQGKVLYVNLELDRASCFHRFKDVYDALKRFPRYHSNIDVWNLRGNAVPMDRLAPKLIRRAQKKDYIAVIIDPIYKVITGDENSADQMANFCNQFDKVCTELGCAVIYCHHHSKGQQGQKRSMDRASGSGVFARDPDALLDLIELEVSDDLITQQENNAVCSVCLDYLQRTVQDWEDEVSQDDLCSEKAMLSACNRLMSLNQYQDMLTDVYNARKEVKRRTAWRIDGTLREFPKFEPVNLWFDYPIHRLDDNSVLKNAEAEGEQPPWKKGQKKAENAKKTRREDQKKSLEIAFDACAISGDVTLENLAEYLGLTTRSVRERIKNHGGFEVNKGIVTEKKIK